jgi:RNA 2',3'-cyclic 3'-phosphodiesterase
VRLFVAIELPEEIREGLRRLLAELRSLTLPVRWVRPEGIHLTLQFLGEVGEERREPIAAALREVAGLPAPFRLQVEGAGTFPAHGAPRVIWAGIGGEIDPLRLLQEGVGETLRPLGFETERRPFTPHLTLGRVKGKGRGDWRAELQRRAAARPGEFEVREMVLFQSRLEAAGACYDALERIGLPAGTGS